VWADAVYQPLLQSPAISKELAIEIRLGFIRKVYGILLAMLLLTIGVAVTIQQYLSTARKGVFFELTRVADNEWMLFIAMIVMMSCMCVIVCNERFARTFPNNYVLLLIFSWAMGILVGFSTMFYTWQTVMLAFIATCFIVISLSVYSYFASSDFVGWAPYFLVALLVLVFFGLVLTILSAYGVYVNALYMVFSVLCVIVFSFFIVYDTQLILGEAGGHTRQFSVDDYAFAALSLYTDIINMFMALVQIMGKRNPN